MSTNYTAVPCGAGYLALRDTGREKLVEYPVVAIAVNDRAGMAMVFDNRGNLVPADSERLPGEFAGVTPAHWPEAK